jgi:predicted Zn-dependent protease
VKSKLFAFLICVVTPVLSFGQDLPDLGDVTEEEFPLAREKVLGNALMRKIRSSDSYVLDPEILQYLDDLGHKLVSRSSVPERNFEFFLINDNSINAFALPGGYVGVHSGLFLSSADESELAGVLGHEIAHIQQRHIARMLASQRKLGVASLAGLGLAILASRSSGQLAEAALATSQAAPLQAMLSFSRDHEREADRFGLGIMSSAGFDPVSAVTFFDRMYRATRVYQGVLPGYMQTHPMTNERMADLQARLASVEVERPESSLHYILIKERIRVISGG